MFVASLEATSGSRIKKNRQSTRISDENHFRKKAVKECYLILFFFFNSLILCFALFVSAKQLTSLLKYNLTVS